MSRHRGDRASESGFTLIELVVVASLFLVVAGSLLSMLEVGFRTQSRQQSRSDVLDQLRSGMERVTKDVRQATSIAATSGQSNLDMCTIVAGTDLRVVYDVSGGALRRSTAGSCGGVVGAATTLVTGLTSSAIFTYAPPLNVPDVPRSVSVSLSVQPSAAGSPVVTASTNVFLRNMNPS